MGAQIEALGARACLAPDFPGFGGRPPGPRDLEGFADAVLQDMDEAGIDRAALVGLSMGGYVAFRVFERVPERVTALVLADTRVGPDDAAGRARRTEQAARARREGVDWLAETMLPGLLGATTRREDPATVSTVRVMVDEADPEGVARALEAMRARPDSEPLLERIQVPALVLVGEEDTLTPLEEARKIVSGIPNGFLTVISGAGHLSNLEAPEAFNEALLSFLK